MGKKLEFYEDAGERADAGIRKILAYKPPSKRAKQLSKADAKPVSQGLNRS